ncbi:MAG: tyrosine-type recombinase/integrase [Verrucomicrobia bacterium]|nr:tyrosine-type recombinase/integrase [Verrucomicrobiota bacterium]
MKQRFRLYRRKHGRRFYLHDGLTGKQASLGTTDRTQALRLLHARNEAEQLQAVNLQIARAYLAAGDPQVSTRTWQFVMDEAAKLKSGPTRLRWERAMLDRAFASIRNLPLLETRPEHFLHALEKGTVCTNIFLRRLHNLALDLTWLPWPVLAKKRWPQLRFKEKRAITWEEHQRIVAGESNAELRDYYELLWHLGGSQTDMASLRAEDVDWATQTISYARLKTDRQAMIRFGEAVVQILHRRPATGFLFPQITGWKESDRGKAFIRRCRLTGVSGVSLHSYRYAWAERAKTCGFPERFAQEALGHSSKAVARAYAKKAKVLVPCQEDYERKIVHLGQPNLAPATQTEDAHPVPAANA